MFRNVLLGIAITLSTGITYYFYKEATVIPTETPAVVAQTSVEIIKPVQKPAEPQEPQKTYSNLLFYNFIKRIYSEKTIDLVINNQSKELKQKILKKVIDFSKAPRYAKDFTFQNKVIFGKQTVLFKNKFLSFSFYGGNNLNNLIFFASNSTYQVFGVASGIGPADIFMAHFAASFIRQAILNNEDVKEELIKLQESIEESNLPFFSQNAASFSVLIYNNHKHSIKLLSCGELPTFTFSKGKLTANNVSPTNDLLSICKSFKKNIFIEKQKGLLKNTKSIRTIDGWPIINTLGGVPSNKTSLLLELKSNKDLHVKKELKSSYQDLIFQFNPLYESILDYDKIVLSSDGTVNASLNERALFKFNIKKFLLTQDH